MVERSGPVSFNSQWQVLGKGEDGVVFRDGDSVLKVMDKADFERELHVFERVQAGGPSQVRHLVRAIGWGEFEGGAAFLALSRSENLDEGKEYTRYLRLDYFEGRTLETWIRSKEWERADQMLQRRVYTSLVETVADLFRLGMAHCDFRDKNILVSDDGNICVVDLALANFGPEWRLRDIQKFDLLLAQLHFGIPYSCTYDVDEDA